MRLLLTMGARRRLEVWLRRSFEAFGIAVAGCFLLTGAVASDCPFTENSVQVVWQEQRLSLCANKAPVSTVLREMARKTGVQVLGLQRPLGATSIQLTAVSPEVAFARLLEGLDFIVVGDLSLRHGTPLIWIRGESHLGANPQPAANFAAESVDTQAGEVSAANGIELQSYVVATDDEGQPEGDPTVKFAKLQDSIQQWDEQGLAAAIKDSDPVLQGNAHEALKAMDPAAAEKALVSALGSDDVSTRVQALQLLQQSEPNDTRTCISAFEKALSDNDAQVRIAAVQGLERLGGPEEMSFVRQAFKDPDPAVRLMVISGAGSQDRSLLTTALDDSEEAVRGAAAEMLKEIQNSGK